MSNLTYCLVLHPRDTAYHQPTKHGRDPCELDQQPGQEPRKRGIPHDDGIVEGTAGGPDALPRRVDRCVGALEAAGGESEAVVVSDGGFREGGGGAARGKGQYPRCQEPSTHGGGG